MKKTVIKRNRRIYSLLFSKEKDYFAENLSMLLSAGIGVSMAITNMAEGATEKSYKKTLQAISTDLDEGSSFWRAIQGRGILNASHIHLAKVGESSGRLSENLKIIADQQKKNKSFHAKLNSALAYPTIILSLTFIIGISVVWFVIPKMAKIFGDMKIDLPLPTRVMIGIGDFITGYPFVFLGSLLSFALLIIIIFFVPGTKKIGRTLLFHIPRLNELFREVEVARFGYIMYSLTEAGIPLTEAIQSIEQSADIPSYRKFYSYLSKSVEEGNSLEKSFKGYKKLKKLIPVQIQQMIVAGERSGNLTTVLGTISGIYEEKIELTSKNLSVILEPILLLVVGAGVLFLALAVVMPIYGLVGGLNVK